MNRRAVTPETPPGTIVRRAGDRARYRLAGLIESPSRGTCADVHDTQRGHRRTFPLVSLTVAPPREQEPRR